MKLTIVGMWSKIDYDEPNPLWNKSFFVHVEIDSMAFLSDAIGDYYYDDDDPEDIGPMPSYEILYIFDGHIKPVQEAL